MTVALLRHPHLRNMDAEGWLADERKLMDRGEWTPPEDRAAAKVLAGLTLGEFAEGWLSSARPDAEDARVVPGPVREPDSANARWLSLRASHRPSAVWWVELR